MLRRISLLCFFALFALAFAPLAARAQATPTPAPRPASTGEPKPQAPSPSPSPTPGPPFSNMNWREIGPALPGGRVAAVAGSQRDVNLYYLGAAGGGVWKSTDGAETWSPVFEKQKVSAIGAVAIDPTNDDVVWVGTGESNPRQNVSYGDGVYKSTDAGKTWTNVGLALTRHISRILIDPRNPNHVIVGALGDVFGPNENRGVYVTEDGGKTWSKTLYVSDQSGVSDMAMDMQHPNVVYAGMWHFLRQPWTFTSGGPDDGLYRSSDGGLTWSKLTGSAKGLPTGITGRIGLAVAPSDGNRVYAIIESGDGILWRSDDAGSTWAMVSSDTLVDQRPFYFTHLIVDPKNADKVYAISEFLAVSTDGGKKFKETAQQVHVDYHAMWIAPDNPNRAIIGADGGIARTVDGGDNWFFDRNIPIGQVYHIATSTENPYWICGGWQDNNGWCGPSNSLDPSGILNKNWIGAVGGDGMWVVPDPADPNWIWGDSENGFLTIYNKVTKDTIFATPYLQNSIEGYDLSKSKYRYNWDSPIAFAPWNPHIGWLGGNVVFQTTDRGRHWTIISPDLTLNDKSHQQPSGGPLVHDVSGAEYSDNIMYMEGSTLHKGELWVGTDDGLVQMTLNGGKSWRNVTPTGVPPYGRVETVAPSTLHDGTVFVNIDRHKSGDFKPYVFMSNDFGKTWTSIVNNLPADQYMRSVRQDIHDGNILYAGTENGVWISFDDGKSWQDFRNNIPAVSVREIRFQPQFDDLVIATHGRSIYVMDDMRIIQQLQRAISQGALVVGPRTAYEYTLHSDDEGTYTDYTGANPPYGAVTYFYQKTPGKTAPVIQILNASGQVIRTIKGSRKDNAGKETARVTNKAGINRYAWDFQIDGPVKWLGAAKVSYQGPDEGAVVPPGRYAVRLTVGGKTFTEPFTVKPDPHSKFTQREYEQSYAFVKKYFREFSTVDTMLNNLDDVKKQLDAINADPKTKASAALQQQVTAAMDARDTLFHQLTADYHNDEDGIQKSGELREDIQSAGFFGTFLITPAISQYGNRMDVEYAQGVGHYDSFVRTTIPALNAALTTAGLKAITGATPVAAGM